ncbi:MAG: twin-arginine translocase subunit TatC [Lentisphaeria bacterium]|nr:twin-arginine translocase subunit TatC [Lentisphaeria bacterium]
MAADPDQAGFLEHLEALRSVLLKTLLLFVIGCVPGWYFSEILLKLLLDYAAPKGFALHYFTLMEPFLTRLKIMLMLSLCVTLPGALWWLWGFISPALTDRERRTLRAPMISILLLAAAGAAVSILFIVPALVRFSLSFAGPEMKPVIGIGDFVSLILMVILAGMLLFQLPMVLLGLLTIGIVDLESVRKKRPIVIVVIFILAAVFSPPDVFSQLLLAIPTWLLFELSLLIYSARQKKT